MFQFKREASQIEVELVDLVHDLLWHALTSGRFPSYDLELRWTEDLTRWWFASRALRAHRPRKLVEHIGAALSSHSQQHMILCGRRLLRSLDRGALDTFARRPVLRNYVGTTWLSGQEPPPGPSWKYGHRHVCSPNHLATEEGVYPVWFEMPQGIGRCSVRIHASHDYHMLGSSWRRVERPAAQRLEQPRALVDREAMSREHLVTSLSRELMRWYKRTALVIVDDEVSTDDAVIRAAQLCVDLRIDGVPICYGGRQSSQSPVRISDAPRHFVEFLMAIGSIDLLQEIHIVCIGAGARLVHEAVPLLRQLKVRGQIATPIPNLIFLEPHVPADDFERARVHYEATGIGRVTNYCFSRRRDALEYGRRPLLMGEMFDSVFVGNLDFQALGTEGENRVLPLLFDLGQLIHRHTLPTLRTRIKCGWFGSHFVLLHADSPSTGDVQESKIHSLRRSQWQAQALFGPDRNYDGTLRDLPCL